MMMKTFMDENFLLQNETAIRLYHETAKDLPILDFHNHLNPKEIVDDVCYQNLAEVWLGGDHYKWRAMRAHGISEELITGRLSVKENAGKENPDPGYDPYKAFLAWADTVEHAIGNPLYHWTHLELQRYFDIHIPLSLKTAEKIWNLANEKLRTPAYSARNLLRMQKAEVLCTTDDPADDLHYHEIIAKEIKDFRVLPSFRPDKAIAIDKPDYADYLQRLAEAAGEASVTGVAALLQILEKRLAFFLAHGCRVSDHSIEHDFFTGIDLAAAEKIFAKRIGGETLTKEEIAGFQGFLLTELGKCYADAGIVMQLHIGAQRNNAGRFLQKVGVDAGFDSLADFAFAPQIAGLLDAMDLEGKLPRVILYCLNPKDQDMLAAMAGNYQSNEEGIRGKVQSGSAWWFCDHKTGMERQLTSLSDVGLLSTFVGMLTDSRSFLSFPRHEYFRRILCNKVGTWVENGEYPDEPEFLAGLIRDICYQNAKTYFGF